MEVEKNLDKDETVNAAAVVCDDENSHRDEKRIDPDNNIGDGNNNDDHDADENKDEAVENSSCSSSSSSKSEEESDEEDTESIDATPTIHFFFNFVNAVEFSDSTHDRTLWTLKSFKEYLTNYFQTEEEVGAEPRPEQEVVENEPSPKIRCAKVFFIFRELNAIVGTALIHQNDLLQSSDTVRDEPILHQLRMYVCMYCIVLYVRIYAM